MGVSWGDIKYLRLRYVSQELLDGMRQKVIPTDNVVKETTTKEDITGKNEDDKVGDVWQGNVLVETLAGEIEPTGVEKTKCHQKELVIMGNVAKEAIHSVKPSATKDQGEDANEDAGSQGNC